MPTGYPSFTSSHPSLSTLYYVVVTADCCYINYIDHFYYSQSVKEKHKNVDDGVEIQENPKIEGDEEIKARGDKCLGKITFD